MKHRRTTRLGWIGAATLVAAAMVVPASLAGKPDKPGTSNSKGVKTFTAKLRGADGMRANFVIRLNSSEKKICWSFSSLKLNGQAAFAGHVHTTPPTTGVTPPVAAYGILLPLGTTGPMPRRGCTTNVDWADELAAVIKSPAAHYVNVHKQDLGVLITGPLKKGAPAN